MSGFEVESKGGDGARGTAEAAVDWTARRNRIQVQIPAETDLLPAIRKLLWSLVVHGDWPNPGPRILSELQLALQEACVNAIRHASGRRPGESIMVAFILIEHGITIEVCDHGPGFDPTSVPEPDAGAMKEGGYGVFIIGEFMDEVRAFRRGNQFVMSMTRYFDADSGIEETERA